MAGAVALARCGLAFDDGAGRAGQDDSDATDLITDARHGASIDLRAADDSAGVVECYRLRHFLWRFFSRLIVWSIRPFTALAGLASRAL